ncbi:DUF4998 domain-containing protein [Sphingobacterium bambusae]|uniref:DUF4998 domain-containing protein n=1 Tax=Sphingobacterium bambusae TaxID=662858 RepID=A0ABW6BIS7_9SPHI|nr:DUF4998 domain-containing protein [Sphingobacterium bambusae]WPL49489.1 DUF4998 domain-containing protein [Sphingobacterium bambusae]
MKIFKLNKILYVFCNLILIWGVTGCQKLDTEFLKFYDGREIVYPGTPSNIKAHSGNGRVKFEWNISPDPSIMKYILYWNNGLDSAIFDAKDNANSAIGDIIIDNIEEGTHFFTIYTVDKHNNRSIPLSVSNVKVYGEYYRKGLVNRPILSTNVDGDNKVTIIFTEGLPTNEKTIIEYTDTFGQMKQVSISQVEREITISNWKVGTPMLYQSSYRPAEDAFDTFFTLNKDRMQIKKDISSVYLSNFSQPFAAKQSDGRFRDPLNWIVNDPVKNHNSRGGWGTDEGTVLVMESGWGANDIINGKLYQNVDLPSGTYSVQIELASFGINTSQVKIVAAPGDVLPDINADGGISEVFATADLDLRNLNFVVPSKGPVSIGFAVNMRGNQFWRIKKINLYAHY